MVKRHNQWRGILTVLTVKGAVIIFSLLLAALANGHLFAQDRPPSASQHTSCPGNCPYCPGGHCVNPDMVHPFDVSSCFQATGDYWCPAIAKPDAYVLTPEEFQALQSAKHLSPSELDEAKKAAAGANSTNK
jgi:hypothetical protein